MKIGENMRSLRKKAGLTQKELAQMSGVATISIRQYESGKRRPQVEQLTAISAALGVSVEELCGVWDSSMPRDIVKALREHGEALETSYAAKGATFALSSVYARDIISAFGYMNERGHQKAADLVWELAKNPEYHLTKTAETPSTASTAESSTPANKPSEGPNQP